MSFSLKGLLRQDTLISYNVNFSAKIFNSSRLLIWNATDLCFMAMHIYPTLTYVQQEMSHNPAGTFRRYWNEAETNSKFQIVCQSSEDRIITISMVQDLPWKADGHSTGHEIPSYGTQRFITIFTNSPPMDPIMSQLNPVHTSTFYFSKIHFNSILLFMPTFPKTALPLKIAHISHVLNTKS
jgi:hypothetical protein